jgi:hypothetical protein
MRTVGSPASALRWCLEHHRVGTNAAESAGRVKPVFDEIVSITDLFCRQHLDAEPLRALFSTGNSFRVPPDLREAATHIRGLNQVDG